jgi:hypothetical protein
VRHIPSPLTSDAPYRRAHQILSNTTLVVSLRLVCGRPLPFSDSIPACSGIRRNHRDGIYAIRGRKTVYR